MHSFKKAMTATLSFLLIFSIGCGCLIQTFMNSQMYYFCDRDLRKQLAGTIDTLFIGASHCVRGVVPKEFDSVMNTKSYVIGGINYTWHAREILLMEEIDRNPLKTVYIEISYNALQRGNETGLEGNKDVLVRLDGSKKKLSYFIHETPLKEYDDMFVLLMHRGYELLERVLLRQPINTLEEKNMGYYAHDSWDISLSEQDAVSLHNSEVIDSNFDSENISTIKRMINECKKRNINVVLFVVPISDAQIWTYSGWNVFVEEMNLLSVENNCDYYDFNLLKNRYELFSDKKSYYELSHLCDNGAKVFSTEFAEIMLLAENDENVKEKFYSSYDGILKASPYNKNKK